MKTPIIKAFLITFISLNTMNYSYALSDETYRNNIKVISEIKKDKKFKYEINIDYPFVYNLANKNVEDKINNHLKKHVQNSKKLFLKNLSEFTNSDFDPAVNSDINIGYNTYYMDKSKISFSIGISSYYRGSAHPNSETLTYNYDLKTGNQILLKDLFKPNSNYLKFISGYSIKELKKKVISHEDSNDWLKEGAGLKADNFKAFNIGKDHLIIYFQSYQVASYAEGPQEVKIPFAKIKYILK